MNKITGSANRKMNPPPSRIICTWLTLLLLCSCGRSDHAAIVNRTADTVFLLLWLNQPGTPGCPDNDFREAVIRKERSQEPGIYVAGDCLLSYDTATGQAGFRLLPQQRMELGTLRLPLHRDNDRAWEFSRFSATGSHFSVQASGAGMLHFVHSRHSWFAAPQYELVIGQQ